MWQLRTKPLDIVDHVRHNNTYTIRTEKSNGQTEEARSEAAGTQTYRHAQPSSRRGLRRPFPRESVLRFQRPAAGALRDAASSLRGRRFCRRRFFGLWDL